MMRETLQWVVNISSGGWAKALSRPPQNSPPEADDKDAQWQARLTENLFVDVAQARSDPWLLVNSISSQQAEKIMPTRTLSINKPINWILFALILAFVALSLGLSCRPRSEVATITILGEDLSNFQALASLKNNYEREHPIRLNFVGNAFDVFNQKANQDLSNGTGINDVILHYGFMVPTYVRNDWVLTAQEIEQLVPGTSLQSFKSDIFQNVWQEVAYYPKQPGAQPEYIGYPYAAATMVLVYNRTLFDDPARQTAYKAKYGEELVVPTDWKHFKQIAEFFTAPDGSSNGLVMEGASGGYIFWEWCNYAYNMGGGVMKKNHGWEGDANTPILIDSPETIAATKYYVSLKPYNYGDFFSTGQVEQQELMRTKKIAMAIMWSDSLPSLTNSPNANDFGFAPVPGTKSVIAGGPFLINKKSQHQREAAEYVLSMMQKSVQVELMKKGLISALKSAYDDPETKGIAYRDAVRHSLERGVYMVESGPDSGAVLDALEPALQRIWKGDTSVENGLRDARKEFEEKRAKIFAELK
jgi:ABC-type glycerol-3-phosphate transport system substrate-binding protein